jgi:hypothetical protein
MLLVTWTLVNSSSNYLNKLSNKLIRAKEAIFLVIILAFKPQIIINSKIRAMIFLVTMILCNRIFNHLNNNRIIKIWEVIYSLVEQGVHNNNIKSSIINKMNYSVKTLVVSIISNSHKTIKHNSKMLMICLASEINQNVSFLCELVSMCAWNSLKL